MTKSSTVASLLLVAMIYAIVHLVVTVFGPKFGSDLSWLYQFLVPCRHARFLGYAGDCTVRLRPISSRPSVW